MTALAGRAEADPRFAPREISGEIGTLFLTPSAYRNALRDFGFDGFTVGMQGAARVLWTVTAALRVGVRAGYLGIRASDVWFHVPDAGLVLRVVAVGGSTDLRPPPAPRIVLDVEAGLALVDTTWERGTGIAAVPRFAVTLGVDRLLAAHLRAGLRLGGQYAPSAGAAGGSYWDPAFAGVTVGVELGGAR